MSLPLLPGSRVPPAELTAVTSYAGPSTPTPFPPQAAKASFWKRVPTPMNF